jgi:hypothetical protein
VKAKAKTESLLKRILDSRKAKIGLYSNEDWSKTKVGNLIVKSKQFIFKKQGKLASNT